MGVKIKAPVNIVVAWHYFTRFLSSNKDWMCQVKELDYVKYSSVVFNAIHQVSSLTNVIRELRQHRKLTCPLYMIMSREDETISSNEALFFFSRLENAENKLLLYSSCERRYPDNRIANRYAVYPELNINHLSHSCLPFAPNNIHYGANGDFPSASKLNQTDVVYGAYNQIEEKFFDFLYKGKLIKKRRAELTFNPDFEYMSQEIVRFILNSA